MREPSPAEFGITASDLDDAKRLEAVLPTWSRRILRLISGTNNKYRKVEEYREAERRYQFWRKRCEPDFWLSLRGWDLEIEAARILRRRGYTVFL
ncbi:MAG: hypothetical protein ACREX3_05875, partial [Gammaproteobacteria bacterium]